MGGERPPIKPEYKANALLSAKTKINWVSRVYIFQAAISGWFSNVRLLYYEAFQVSSASGGDCVSTDGFSKLKVSITHSACRCSQVKQISRTRRSSNTMFKEKTWWVMPKSQKNWICRFISPFSVCLAIGATIKCERYELMLYLLFE